MTCRDIRQHIEQWARGDGLPELVREALAAHLVSCASCAERVRIVALRSALLRAMTVEEADPAPAFYARVSARVREQSAGRIFSFWETVRAFSATVVMVAVILLLVLVGVNVYIHQRLPAERRDFVSALMERNLSESERVVFAGEGELSPEGVLSALALEPRGSR